MVSFPKGTSPSTKRKKVSDNGAKPQTKKSEVKYKTYLVGCCIVGFRQNLMIKVKANNDYFALLGAMKKLRRHVSDMYPENSQFIEANWEAEQAELCKRFRDYDQLKGYLAVAGFVMTTPFILEDNS